MPVLIVVLLMFIVSCVLFSLILRGRRVQMALNRARFASRERARAYSLRGTNMSVIDTGVVANGDNIDYGKLEEILVFVIFI